MADVDERGAAQALEDWQRWSTTARGRTPASWAAELRRDPLLLRARVVVDVVFGGEIRILASTTEMVCPTLSGTDRLILPWLLAEPDLSEDLSPGDPDPASRSVSVALPGEMVKPVELRRRRRPLVGYGEVSIAFDGMAWEDRLVFVRGPCSGRILHGTEEAEIVSFTISDPVIGGASIPAWVIDATRWPETDGETFASRGERVPIVVGIGRVPCIRVRTSDGGGNDDFLVGYGSLTVDSVLVDGVTNANSSTVETTDGEDLPVTLLRWSLADASAAFASVYARVRDAEADTLGIFGAIRKILRTYGRVDPSRISERLFAEAEARAGLVGISSGSRTSPLITINQPVGALEYVTGTLCEDFPWISMSWDGPGLGPVVVDHRSRPVAKLTAGEYPVIARADGSLYEWLPTDELVTRVVLRYDYQPAMDAFNGLDYRDASSSDLCAEALRLRREEREIRIDSITIGDASTAALTADWLVEHLSRPACEVVLLAYPVAYFAHRVGDPVRWTDPDQEMSDEPAIVIGRRWSNGKVELVLRIWPSTWAGMTGASVAAVP